MGDDDQFHDAVERLKDRDDRVGRLCRMILGEAHEQVD